MYSGNRPFWVIGILAGLLAIIGIWLAYLTMDDASAVTGTVIAPTAEPLLIADPSLPQGSMSRPLMLDKPVEEIAQGQEILVDDYLLTVSQIKHTDKIGTYVNGNFQGKQAAHSYYIFQVSITNKGTKENYAPPEMFTLTDGAAEYLIEPGGTRYLFESSIYVPVLRTGVRRNIKFAFDVPDGEHALLIYGTDKIYKLPV